MNPRLSIIMTTFNMGDLIKRAVVSVLNQTFSDFELLIINDASQDNTLEELLSIRDARIRIFDNPTNSGTYFSRNIGVLHSKGDFIAFVDSDDLISPNRFESILKVFEKNPSIMHIDTNFMRFLESSKKLLFKESPIGVGFAVIRRQVVQDIGYFMPVKASGDAEYTNRLKKFYGAGKSIQIADFTYWASQRADNLTAVIGFKERWYFKNYCKNKFYPKGDLYVAFPFEKKLLAEFSHLKVFANLELGREQNVRTIEVTKSEKIAPNLENLNTMLSFSENAMKKIYSSRFRNEKGWKKHFSAKGFQGYINRLRRILVTSWWKIKLKANIK